MTILKKTAVIVGCIIFASSTIQFSSSAKSKKQKNEVIKVSCVGNSITYGMTIADPQKNSYPSVLQNMLGDGYKVGNFGKSGATLLRKGHRPYNEQEEYAKAMDFAGDIVVIHLGVNDTDPRDYPDYGDYFVKDYVTLIDSLKSVNPNARFILANLTPILAKHYRFKSGTRAWRDSIRNLIPVVAEITGAELIDFGEVLRDHPNLLPDGIHPNEEGAKILAETVYGAITGDHGGLQLPEIYSDGMVLQRYKPLRINGIANTGKTITVTIGENSATAVADNTGKWTAVMPPMKEATDLTMTVTDGTDKLVFNDVAIGEVWLAAGQSNMEFQMRRTSSAKEDLPLAGDSLLRLFDMKPVAITNDYVWSEEEVSRTNSNQHYHPTSWVASNPDTAKEFSAVAWHFGKMLRDSLNVPVGIINNAIGGSTTDSWIDIETLEHGLPEILVNWQTNDYMQPWVRQRIKDNIGVSENGISHRHPYEPSYLFSSAIRPLREYPIAGAIWYQGESNAHNVEVHEQLFPMLVESWRKEWSEPELPLIFVQLSSISRPSWPWFRDSQRRLAENLEGVYMAVSSDWGDSLDVHPRNKKPIGQRLGRQALNHVYSMTNIVPEGPGIVKAEQTAPNTVLLSFDYAEGLKTSDGNSPITFEVAEFEGVYYPVDEVEIVNGNQIILHSDKVANPTLVRYGWQPFTRANLVNGENLPASTFKIGVEKKKNQ